MFEFISKSAANLTDHNVTTTFQRVLRNTLKECKTLIGTENKGKFITLTPKPPNLRGLIKVHKKKHVYPPNCQFQKCSILQTGDDVHKQIAILHPTS